MRTHVLASMAVTGLSLIVAGCADAPAAPPQSTAVAVRAAEPQVLPVAAAEPRSKGPRVIEFTDARKQTREFIGYYRTIALTPEQERIKVEALSALAAPCCAKYTLATCCCPCNMSKAVWGMAAWLIVEKGQDVEQVRQAASEWIKFINPNGFSGEACFKGGCKRPTQHDGCGGMDESELL